MINIKCHNQASLFDDWGFLSDKRRKLLDQSWAGLFRDELLCELPVKEFSCLFSNTTGRSTKELHTILGTLLLQQVRDLTDLETVEQLAFNIQWHYALNISQESDAAKYLCLKTLWTMRRIMAENGLEKELFDRFTGKLARVFSVDTAKQRLDSVHISSNMARLGRIRIFANSTHAFLKNLKRHHPDEFHILDEKLVGRYFDKKSLDCFSMIKPSESSSTLSSVGRDLFSLVRRFEEHPDISRMLTFRTLKRVLSEQCRVVEKEDGRIELEIKKPKEIPSDSLQNPSDPDATYSGHKGQGYQVQVMETYSERDPETPAGLNLITHVEVEPAHNHDGNALIPAISSTESRDLSPKELLADSLYGSDDNVAEAAGLGVELVAPAMGGDRADKILLSDFEFTEKDRVAHCPMGHAPVKQKRKKDRYSVAFEKSACRQCPRLASCPVKESKKRFYLRFTEKTLRLDIRRGEERTDEFRHRYRYRAGIEATMSEYDRRTGVKRLRYRGLKKVRFCATLKAAGINLYRAARVRAERALERRRTDTGDTLSGGPGSVVYLFKERLDLFFCGRRVPGLLNSVNFMNPYRMAA